MQICFEEQVYDQVKGESLLVITWYTTGELLCHLTFITQIWMHDSDFCL